MPRAMLRVLCLCCFAASFRLPGAPARRSAPARPATSSATDDAEIIRSRIRSLRLNIVRQRREVDALEKVLECSSVDGLRKVASTPVPWRANEQPWRDSARVLLRRMIGARDPAGFLVNQTSTGLRISKELVFNGQLVRDVLPNAPLLFSHASGIYARLEQLEPHVPGIMAVLNAYLPILEPHLDDIMERFDDIEPHLPFVLDNIDVLAPHVGQLLAHIDELLLYADSTDGDDGDGRWAEALLPFVGYFASRLDALGPHLPLLRPHLPTLMPHLRRLAPHVDRFAPYPEVSAHADVLLWYFGPALRVPGLHYMFRVRGAPRLCAFLAVRLPRRPVRGACANVECDIGDLYTNPRSRWNSLGRGGGDEADVALVERAVQRFLDAPAAKTSRPAK